MSNNEAVWKYPLDWHPGSNQYVELPLGSEVLHFASQDDIATIWCRVDTNIEAMERRAFSIQFTGAPFSGGDYIGTVQKDGYVWHLFEVTE